MAIRSISRQFAKLQANPEKYKLIKESFYTLYEKTECMPVILRFAWHDAGTYDKKSKTGGPRASIRFAKESGYNYNKGLDYARARLDEIKNDFPHESYADLMQIGGTTAVEYCKGPVIPFRFGRIDAKNDAECVSDGRLPDGSQGVRHLRDVFYRMGLEDVDIVALSGGHTLGRASKDRSGWEGAWTTNPLLFDNSYFIELLYKKHQGLLRLPTDEALLLEPGMKAWVEIFAADSKAFFNEYQKSHAKLSELGYE